MSFIDPADMKKSERLPGWHGRSWHSEAMSFTHYDVAAGCSIHEHHHPEEEVWVIIDGRFEVTVDGDTQIAGPGFVALVPPDVLHSVRVIESGRALVANHPLREDFG